MPLELRAATPDDVDAVIPLIHSSGPDVFDYVFSVADAQESLRFLHFAFSSGRGRFGWRNHSVAVLDDCVVGIGTAYGPETNARFFFEDGWLIARFYGLRAPVVMWRGLATEQVLVPPARGEWMIAHLGMAPARRGQGIGARMVHFLIDRGARAGQPMAVLDVSVENPRAEALYRRLGFALVIQRKSDRKNRFGRVIDHRRMALPIRASA